eukprot:gene35060-42461_t
MSSLFEEFRPKDFTETAERPMFSLRKLDWEGRSRSKTSGRVRNIQQVVLANGFMVIATSSCSIVRWRMLDSSSKEPEEIEVGKADEAIDNILLDPSGHHLLVVMRNGDNYYLHSKSTKPKKLSKMSGTLECAAFDNINSSELNTRSFLVGTSTGTIYEISLDSAGKEKVCQQVFQLDSQIPITSLYFEALSGDQAGGPSTKYLILFATSLPTRLYHIVGSGGFQQIFSDYFMSHSASSFTELPGEIKRAELHCYGKSPNTNRVQMFALLTGAGIYSGSLLGMSSAGHGDNGMLMEAQLIPYVESEESALLPAILLKPLSFSVSDFHFLVLRGETLQVVSSLNGGLVQELPIPRHEGIALRMARDLSRETTVLCTTKSIYLVEVYDEARLVWNIYLKKALATGDERWFDLSFEHSKTRERKQQVMLRRAEFCADNQQWDKCALYLARSGVNFDEAAIKLSTADVVGGTSGSHLTVKLEQAQNRQLCIRVSGSDLNPLKVFLLEVLKTLPSTAKSQRAMLCVWLMELFLHQISATQLSSTKTEQAALAQRVEDCMDFIRTNRVNLDVSSITQLLISRDHRQLLLFFSRLTGDYHRVVTMLLTDRKYSEAINVLHDAPYEKISTFVYEVASVLMVKDPEGCVELLLGKPQLQPSLLLPALLAYTEALDHAKKTGDSGSEHLTTNYQGEPRNFAIVYLEEMVKRLGIPLDEPVSEDLFFVEPLERSYDTWRFSSPDPVLLPTLLCLLCKYDTDNESKVVRLMQELCAMHKAQALQEVVTLDVDFVLRRCRQYGRRRGVMYAYILMGQPVVAAEEALVLDAQLAKAIAIFETDNVICHAIWLAIARHTVATVVDMKHSIDLIEESQHLLSIEDLLPLLPDFTEIDLFKEQICSSLDKCGVGIQEVKTEMQELASSVENTLQELQGIKQRAYSTASSLQRCELCSDLLYRDQFYLFP